MAPSTRGPLREKGLQADQDSSRRTFVSGRLSVIGCPITLSERCFMETAEQALQEAQAHVAAGDHEAALAAFARAESLYDQAGDRQRCARACTNKALVAARLQRFDEAIDGFRTALRAFQEGDEFIRVAEQYGNIGSCHRDLGQPDEALESYGEALAIYQELGLRERAADQCTNIAYAHFMKKGYDEAMRWYREALTLYTLTGSEEKRALTAENVARLEAALTEPEE
jgi:tetratricopeptide (TPR) repeat protein